MRINFIAIVLGFIATLFLTYFQFWFYTEGCWSAIRSTSGLESVWIRYVEPVYVAIQSIIPGVIAGYVAKKNGMFHAGMVAILGALVSSIYFSEFTGGYLNAVFSYIFRIGIFITISGLLGEKLSQKHIAL